MVPAALLTRLSFDAPPAAYQRLPEPLDAVARRYDFHDGPALLLYASEASDPANPVHHFEAAVEAVIDGDIDALTRLLDRHPSLPAARSTRVTSLRPPSHRATLLHYLAANGVEGYRQRSPANAVDVARLLLHAGADPNATATCYGRECTTMGLLVSSTPPAVAGTQVPLVEALAAAGAVIDAGTLRTALTFGFQPAAEALVRLGVPVADVAAAAGLGRTADTARLLPSATAEDLHLALALAAQLGHAAAVELLLRARVDPNRFNPPGAHSHSTPLHQAALAGHLPVVRLLVEQGARTDIADTIFHGTPLGWAEHGGRAAVAAYLRSRSKARP